MTEPWPDSTVSVAFIPRQLRGSDQWRFVLRRINPGARAPLRFAVSGPRFLTPYLGFVGEFLALMHWVNAPASVLVVSFMAVGLLVPLRLWRTKRALMATMGPSATYEVGVGPTGATVQTSVRSLRVRWTVGTTLIVTLHEVTIRFPTLDVINVPVRAFRDDVHLGQFVTVVRSGLATAPVPSAHA